MFPNLYFFCCKLRFPPSVQNVLHKSILSTHVFSVILVERIRWKISPHMNVFTKRWSTVTYAYVMWRYIREWGVKGMHPRPEHACDVCSCFCFFPSIPLSNVVAGWFLTNYRQTKSCTEDRESQILGIHKTFQYQRLIVMLSMLHWVSVFVCVCGDVMVFFLSV